MTSYTYTDRSQFAAKFTGRIQIDRSGCGHCWVDVHPDDLRHDALVGLANEQGEIKDGATALVGGKRYRAVAE